MHMMKQSKGNAHCFQCSTCQYKSYHKSSYNRHLSIHYEIKPVSSAFRPGSTLTEQPKNQQFTYGTYVNIKLPYMSI
nr:unnamed protein product [Callosobruchus analis]